MSEIRDIKDQFGKLGLFLIEKAEKEIREINQNTLFQKAQIKKNYIKRISDISIRIKDQYLKTYNDYIINAQSSTILKLKQDILEVKNDLLGDLKLEIKKRILLLIEQNYELYLEFLFRELKEFVQNKKNLSNIILFFNERDYDYIGKNSKTFSNLFTQEVDVKLLENSIIGGYKAYLKKENIWYDRTIENIIVKNSTLVENEFALNFSEDIINNYILKFDNFITKKKENIQEFLNEFSRTG